MAEKIIDDSLIARTIGVYQPFTVAHLAEVSGATEAGAYAWMTRRTKKQTRYCIYIAVRWIYKNKTYMMLIPCGAKLYGLSGVKADVCGDGGVLLT